MKVSEPMDICIPKNGLHSCKSEGRLRFIDQSDVVWVSLPSIQYSY